MIVIVGESGSGKSTLEQEIVNKLSYKKLISHTTRPMRDGEINGKDYYFIDNEKFEEIKREDMFIETTEYNGWSYGLSSMSLNNKSVAVITPHGLRQLVKFIKEYDLEEEFIITSIYLKVDRKSRLKKLIDERDDIEESYRRNLSDLGMFEGIEDEASLTIDNREYRLSPEVIVDQIIHEFKKLGVNY